MIRSTKNRIVRALSLTGFRARVLIAVALASVLTTACDVHGVSAPGTLARIAVTPNATMIAGAAQQMVALGYDAEGRVVAVTPTWTVAASGGTVASTGVFTAGTVPGLFTNTVVASVGNISGSASITVLPGALATITVVPTPVTLAVTATQQFTAVGKDISGNIVAFTPTWSVIADGGAITQAGIFTAGNTPGTYTNTVQASSSSLRGYATVVVTTGPLASISVTPNPDTLISNTKQQFVAVGKDAGGNVISIASTWSVVAGGGTIDGGGLFTAGTTLGTFANTVKATSGTMSGTATVVVKLGPLAFITVTPNPAHIVVLASQQMTAVGTDVGGNVIPIAPVWAVVTTANGATITQTGMYTAGTVAGTFTNKIRASALGLAGFATVISTAGPMTAILVSPSPVDLFVGDKQQFTATGRDESGNLFALVPTWSVVNAGGTIGSAGLFTAGQDLGTFNNTIQATSGGLSGFATVNVVSPLPPPPSGGGGGGSGPALDILGNAAPNGIMAGTAVTCITGGTINADVSISPGNTITGFGPCVITGVKNLGNAVALAAQGSLTTAYNTLAGMACPPANAIVANLGGTTKPAGVYCTASGIGVTGTLTLNGGGDPNAVFVFQAGTSLVTAGNIVLIGGAQAQNVFWQVGSSATLGTASQWQGNILALTSITLVDNATLKGRALARNGAVTLGTNNVITLP